MNYGEDNPNYILHKKNTYHSNDGGRCYRFYSSFVYPYSLLKLTKKSTAIFLTSSSSWEKA